MRRMVHTKPPPANFRKRPLVLYVEDNDDNWAVAEMRLEKSYQLVRASNDREACAALKEHADSLYVILMDIELQGSRLNGVALTRLLRGKLKDSEKPPFAQDVPVLPVPVIFTTAYKMDLTDELREAGGNLVVPKPVEFMRLMRELTSMHLKTIGDHASRG